METIPESIPLIVFEDDDLLVVNKPAGFNTHAPSPYAGEGLYDWLRHREPRWAQLAIVHRLDKDTSGLLVFGKTPLANRSLTGQFTRRDVRKTYLFLSDRPTAKTEFTVISALVKAGEKYVSRPLHAGGDRAETRFEVIETPDLRTWVQARPITGRTHQIRVHAADSGLPILGDVLYGGTPADRLCLHAQELAFEHPATGTPVLLRAPALFSGQPRLDLRRALFDETVTNACRWCHAGSDDQPGWFVDRLGDFLLSQSEHPISLPQRELLARWCQSFSLRGAYHKVLSRRVRGAPPSEMSPQPVLGEVAPERFSIRENGILFELSFQEGYSFGLFLDQRDNRRRLLSQHIAAGFPLRTPVSSQWELLNAFAYTCGFSLNAARAGARTTSLDLSKKYLDWGRRNFTLNGLDPTTHEFLHGDAFDWMRRLARKKRLFDVIVLDPPTFSRSKEHGVFQAEKDYGTLVGSALPLLRPGGVLLASTNAAQLEPERFVATVEQAITSAGRACLNRHYAPQPPDFPVSRAEPAYLKTLWVRLS